MRSAITEPILRTSAKEREDRKSSQREIIGMRKKQKGKEKETEKKREEKGRKNREEEGERKRDEMKR